MSSFPEIGDSFFIVDKEDKSHKVILIGVRTPIGSASIEWLIEFLDGERRWTSPGEVGWPNE